MHSLEEMADQLAETAWPLSEQDDKLVIYQLLPRLFGNKQTPARPYGKLEENGVGKFEDINEAALLALRQMGVTHIWYTGVIEHASMTAYEQYGIPANHPCIVKGRAGSPYAIRDYYDVSPDLAVSVPRRMQEFEALIDRTHRFGMNVLIDFVPNHVARQYASDARPAHIPELGADDDPYLEFHPNNNFYYLPGQTFVPPPDYRPFGPDDDSHLQLPPYVEFPAKASGNDIFSPAPSLHDWFETVKLNYGIDLPHDWSNHFDPIPATWHRMLEILTFWADKGVDGFRCDMVHLVPVPFWQWAISRLKAQYPSLLFIAEIYEPERYGDYLHQGQFDYLYDKVGLYDQLRSIMQGQGGTQGLWQALAQSEGMSANMLRFLENHDEQRIASPHFAGDPWRAVPAMVLTACLSTGPVMVYFGQEVGEAAAGASGFSGDDGRTTLFDYWHVPEHQKWMNGGRFDGGGLSEDQRQLRQFYQRLLRLCRREVAIRSGHFYALPPPPLPEGQQQLVYAFLRHCPQQQILVLAHFGAHQSLQLPLFIPGHAWECMQLNPFDHYQLRPLLEEGPAIPLTADTHIDLPPLSARIFELVRE